MPGRDGELVCVCTNTLVLHSSKRDLLDALAVAALAQEVDLFVLAGLDYLFHPLVHGAKQSLVSGETVTSLDHELRFSPCSNGSS
jgi:hypothetical protein